MRSCPVPAIVLLLLLVPALAMAAPAAAPAPPPPAPPGEPPGTPPGGAPGAPLAAPPDTGAVAAAADSLTAGPPPEPAPAPLDLSGVWVLDEKDSDDPDRLARAADRRGGMGGGPSGMGGPGGGMGSSGRGPGDAAGGPDARGGTWRGGGRPGAGDGEPGPPSPAEGWNRLLITQDGDRLEIEDGSGRVRRLALDARPVPGRGPGGLATRAYREADAIVVVTERDGTPVRTASYRLDPRTGRLHVTITPLRRRAAPQPVELVYDRP